MRAICLAVIPLILGTTAGRAQAFIEYFPPGELAAFNRQWYGPQLVAMREPSLWRSTAEETYRFLWLRSFHPPMAVRLVRSDTTRFLVTTILSGAGGYDPGHVIRKDSVQISRDEWNSLVWGFTRAGFWTMSTHDSRDDGGVDGAQWIVEARRGANYHVADRWTPRADGPARAFREACLALVRAAAALPDTSAIY